MSGIYGILGESDKNLIKKMNKVMIRRGSVSYDYCMDDLFSFGVTQSNIDGLNDNRPISNEDDDVYIILDGKIFNHKEIKKVLIKKGHKFKTSSDAEVVIHAYEDYGEMCVNHLQGMFAFAIWDGKKLFLARDRFGIKPLFYTCINQNLFLFASEIKSILQCSEVQKHINIQALYEYEVFRYISWNSTFFLGIKQLPPGHILNVRYDTVNNKFSAETKRYWEVQFNPNNNRSEEETIKHLEDLLETCINRQINCGIPTGVFLSGGIDSSLIVAIMSKISKHPIDTFTVSDNLEHPDVLYARLTAEHFGTEHHEVIMGLDSVVKKLPEIALSLENPIIRWYLYLLSEKAGGYCKATLSGFGADEFFGGTSYYQDLKSYKETLHQRLYRFSSSKETHRISNILNNLFQKSKENFTLHTLQNHINSDLLFIDHSSMAHGLEMHFPYLDENLVQFVNTIPSYLKINHRTPKYILRKIAVNFNLPKDIITRKKYGLPSSSFIIWKKLEDFASDLIEDKYMQKHPYRKFFLRKSDILLFDLFYYIFIENNCELSPNFTILDLY